MLKKIKTFIQFLEDLKLFKQYQEQKDDFGYWFDVANNAIICNDVLLLKDCIREIKQSIVRFDSLMQVGVLDRNAKAINATATKGKLPKAGVK